jgi:tetratricopeptide (TPR) repeat protein
LPLEAGVRGLSSRLRLQDREEFMNERALAALEEARELLETDPSASLRRLPAAGALPVSLRPERDYLAAEAWRARGYFGSAEPLYRRVLKRTRPKEDPALWIEAALGSASGLRSVGEHAAASALLGKSRSLAKSSGILRAFADRIELETALVDRAAERYPAALRVFRARLRRAKARREWREAAFLLWAIGGCERFQGLLAASEKSFRESLRLAALARDDIGRGYALFGLGGVVRVRGRLAEAEKHYAAAGRLFAKTDDDFAKAYAFCGRANALRQMGRLDDAERSYRKSRTIYAKLGDPVDLAYVDWGLGEILLKRGKPREALAPLRLADAGFTRGRETRGEVLAKMSIARASHAVGKTREGEALFSKAVSMARRARIHTHLESYT